MNIQGDLIVNNRSVIPLLSYSSLIGNQSELNITTKINNSCVQNYMYDFENTLLSLVINYKCKPQISNSNSITGTTIAIIIILCILFALIAATIIVVFSVDSIRAKVLPISGSKKALKKQLKEYKSKKEINVSEQDHVLSDELNLY